MAADPRFHPGFDVDPTTAQKALDGLPSARGAKIVSIGDYSIMLEVGGRADTFRCAGATRLAALVGSGRCALSDGTVTFGLLTEHGVLVVPASDEGSTISPTPSVDPNVCVLDDGVALYSPTEGGAWHLFGVAFLSSPVDE